MCGRQICGFSSFVQVLSREATRESAPLPMPVKIDTTDLSNQSGQTHLGSAWNRAGTWEEKNLNIWASGRIKELLVSMEFLELSGGRATVVEVTRCYGDAFFEIKNVWATPMSVKGEWLIGEEKKVKGHINVPDFTFGELDDLQIEVKLSDNKDIPPVEQPGLKTIFTAPFREKIATI